MSKPVNIANAKARSSELIDRCLTGEDVVIARRNRPLVRLVVWAPPQRAIRLGRHAGTIDVSDDSDAPLEQFDDYQP